MTNGAAAELAREVAVAHGAASLAMADDIAVSFSSGGLAFAGKGQAGSRRLRWQPEDLGAFAAAALWTYVTLPLLLDRAERVDRPPDAGGVRLLRIQLPRTMAGHSSVQTLHIGPDGLIRRHDYTATTFGTWARATQVITSYGTFDGVPVGTTRRVTPRLGRPLSFPTSCGSRSTTCSSLAVELTVPLVDEGLAGLTRPCR